MIPTIADESQEICAAWREFFRGIQEELAEVRAILDAARIKLQAAKDDNERRSDR